MGAKKRSYWPWHKPSSHDEINGALGSCPVNLSSHSSPQIAVCQSPEQAERRQHDQAIETVSATSTLTSHRIDHVRKGFFDLPREIRDLIHDHSVMSMRQHKNEDKECCNCRRSMLAVMQATPPHFAITSKFCLVPDRWLYTSSLVSKQYAIEARATFFQTTAFHIDDDTFETFWGQQYKSPSIPSSTTFVQRLGGAARDLRRITIRTSYFCLDGEEERPLMYAVSDVEEQLRHLADLLHPRISILFVVKKRHAYEEAARYFGCRLSDGIEKRIVAQELSEEDLLQHWNDYMEYWQH